MIFILLIILIIQLCIINIIFKDFLSPSFGVCAAFVFSIMCAAVNVQKWSFTLSDEAFFVILYSVNVYFIVELFIRNSRKKLLETVPIMNRQPLIISKIVYILSILLMVLCGIKYYKDIIYITSKYGDFSTWNSAVKFYRDSGITGNISEGVSSLSSNLYIFSIAAAYVYGYLFIYNLSITKNKAKNMLYLVPIIIFCIETIITGGRLHIIRLFIGMVYLYIFLLYSNNVKKQISIKNILKIFLLMFILLYVFTSLSSLVGRVYKGDIFYYITSYIGGSIPLLDLFLHDGVKHEIWGYETFPSLLKMIGRFFNIDSLKSIYVNKEFRALNGYSLGNVYTALRAYISDFGLFGLTILVALHSFTYSIYYKTLTLKKIYTRNVDLGLLIYMFIAHAIYLFSIDDRFYMNIISIESVKIFFIFYILTRFISVNRKENNNYDN